MKSTFARSLLVAALFHAGFAQGQEAKSPTSEEIEARFKESMTNVVLSGRWSPLKDGVLGEPKEDKYNIVSIEKSGGDNWIINAKMKYGGREFVAPIPVQLRWVGDSAVLMVDKLTIPGPNGYAGTAYSARLIIHEKTYAGHWSGGDRAGLMNGVITKASDSVPPVGAK